MHRFRRRCLQHVGYSLAVDAATHVLAPTETVLAARAVNCTNDNATNFVNSLELKARYSGEVDGMLALLGHFSAPPTASSPAALRSRDFAPTLATDADNVDQSEDASSLADGFDDVAIGDLPFTRAERAETMRRLAQVLLTKYRTFVARYAHHGQVEFDMSNDIYYYYHF